MRRTKPGQCSLTVPLFTPVSNWKPPVLSELPSWEGQFRVSVDTEFSDLTLSSLGLGARRGVKVSGYSFAFDDGTKFYVPVRHPEGNVDCVQGMQYFRDQAKGFTGELVGANITTELDILNYEPTGAVVFNPSIIRDVLINDALIYEMQTDGYSLEAVGKRRVGEGKDEGMLREAAATYGADLKKKKGWKKIIPHLPSQYVGPYGEEDALLPLKIWGVQRGIIADQNLQESVDLESQLIPVVLKMRQRGVRIDFDHLDKVETWARQEELDALDKVYHISGHRIRPGDTMKLGACSPAFEALGITIPMKWDDKSKKLKKSLDKEFLGSLTHPIGEVFLHARIMGKLYATFVKSIRSHATNGRIHTTFNQIIGSNDRNEATGAAFGRLSCVAKGTLIEVVRDCSEFPKGVPIEDVKPGDLAYSYDSDRKLCLRKVQWAGKTGHRKVVRLHWRGYGGKHTGYLDVTPEHLIRRSTGEYVEASTLKPFDSVMALSRGVCGYGYERLWPTGSDEISREHRFIYEQMHGTLPEHVHHENHNKRDNRPENLEGMTASEHTAHHSSNKSPELLARVSAAMKKQWEENHETRTACMPRGEGHPGWLGLAKEQLAGMLEKSFWSLTNAARENGVDFATFKKHALLQGFDLQELKRLNTESKRERKVWPFDGRARHHNGKKKTRLVKNNHQIVRIEYLDEEVDVYDLTIEDTHNFIAGEVCVHNCKHPNLQQQPSRGKHANFWRGIYIPEEGTRWGCLDACFSPDTDILTLERGFIPFPDLLPSDTVAQFDTDTQTIDFAKPLDYQRPLFQGELVGIYGRASVDLMVTPNHACLLQNKAGFFKVRADAYPNKWGVYQHMASTYEPVPTYAVSEKEMITSVAVQADGTLRSSHYRIWVSRTRKVERCTEKVSFQNTYKCEIKGGQTAFTVGLDSVPLLLPGPDKTFNRERILGLSLKQRQDFLNEILLWDGTGTLGAGKATYSTTNQINAQIVQEVAILSGVKSILTAKDPPNRKRIYLVYVSKKIKTTTETLKITREKYDGYVYCVTMPKGTVVVRRNGRVSITSQSQQEPRWTTHFAALLNLTGAKAAANAYCTDPKIDNHDFMARITGLKRTDAKALFLGLSYGEGGAKLCHSLKLPTRWCVRFREAGAVEYFENKRQAIQARQNYSGDASYYEVAGEAGQAIIDQFNDRAPYIKELAKYAEQSARKTGQVRVLGGRVIHFPMKSNGEYDWSYKALNRVIQGSAGMQVKMAMINLHRQMPELFLQLQVHDEIDASFESVSQMKQAARIMSGAAGKTLVPFRIDIEHGPNWGSLDQVCGHETCESTVNKQFKVNGIKETYYCEHHTLNHAS